MNRLSSHLPWEYPISAITSPTFKQNIGSSLIGLLKLLFHAPITEVRRACLEALRNDNFIGSGYKHFQGEERHSQPAHELVQCGIVAVAAEDVEAAMTIVRHYLADTWSACLADGRYHSPSQITESRIMFSEALKFVARIFLSEKPKRFRWGKLDGNPLYLEPKLLEQLFIFVEKKQKSSDWSKEINIILRAVAVKLRRELSLSDALDSEEWRLYELLFRYACKSWDGHWLKWYPSAALRSMRVIAHGVIDGRVRFEADTEFGHLLRERALTVCYQFLWRFNTDDTVQWLKERHDLCSKDISEMNGEQAVREFRTITDIMRYCPNMLYARELEDRRFELLKHLSSCVSFMFPLSSGGPVMR